MSKSLAKVIGVDSEKCISCHACIAACPVKYCNDGSSGSVGINPDMCIACGHCIAACTHGARLPLDDFDEFLGDLKSGQPIVVIVSPAVASNFPGQYLNLNGWLKQAGVQAIFDVSFGAELTIKSYLEHMKDNSPGTVIAQPCPAIVSYIEIYKPELLPYLAPSDSPMLHTIKMIRRFYPEFAGHRVAVLSPCLAKKREFDATGLGDYNVTYRALAGHFTRQAISLSDYPAMDYDNPPAERAVLFSTPGGLLRTAARELPGLYESARKIEGVPNVYHYLRKLPENIAKGIAPLLVDCLNCEMGCNGGPGTLNMDKSADEIESLIEQRNREMQKKHRKKGLFAKFRARRGLRKTIEKFWERDLYSRVYLNLADNCVIRKPDEQELKAVYESMRKYSAEDIYDCCACGYGECERMAVAIHNRLNQPENCHHYKQALIVEEKEEIEQLKTAIERKNMQEEQLKTQKLESLGILAGGIAHDFNNILTGIIGNLSLANARLGPAHNVSRCLSDCEKAAVRASKLTQQLLTFARGGEPVKKLMHPAALVRETVSFVMRGSNVRSIVELADDLWSIEADSGQLSQALNNLLINAVQSMPNGGEVTVRVTNETLGPDYMGRLAPGQYIAIAIEDRGCGIPPDILANIFDPYFTTKPEGTGLGLASVYSIAKRHGGAVGVSSTSGMGSRFTIHLPASPGERPEAKPVSKTPVPAGNGRILLMDDEEFIRDIASDILEFAGYQVECCAEGGEAVELFRSAKQRNAPFDAVILDLTVPGGMGGKEAADQILGIDPAAILVVSSGYSNDPVVANYGHYGFRGALPKPFNVSSMARELERLFV